MHLQGKKVLFIGPAFYNYHYDIVDELSSCGAKVEYFPEILNTLTYRFSRLYCKNYSKVLEKKYLNDIFEKLQDNYDYFFLIRGEIISSLFLDKLRLKIPKAVFIMYQWDSYENNPNYLKILHYFDKVLTFDMVDAKKKLLDYLPLFYTKEYENLKLDMHKEYDIVFFGAYHSDRLSIVKKLHYQCLKQNLKFYSVVYISKMAFIIRLLKGEVSFTDYKYVTFQPVSKSVILEAYKKTKSVLDIESIGQEGLTIRTLEVLGASIKLITTNKNIQNEQFYDKKKILFLKRGNMKDIDQNFFISDNSQNAFLKEYSLEKWVKRIFS